jgi:hypothetical protein
MSHVHIHRVETVKDRTLPAFAEAEHMFQRVQQRAFELFAKRGFGHGQALEDWLSGVTIQGQAHLRTIRASVDRFLVRSADIYRLQQ